MRSADRRIVLGLYRSHHRRELLGHALDRGVTDLDTAYNYHGGASHRTLVRVAGDLLSRFQISTKVGYFPNGDHTEHSLDTARLRQAISQSAEELSCQPAVVLLHNPETTVAWVEPAHGRGLLSDAIDVLQQACKTGECGAWGISTWDPGPLLTVLDSSDPADTLPVPDALMIRGGLLVNAATLHAAEWLCARLGVDHARRWAMSPFGGIADAEVWDQANPHTFLSPGQPASNRQAAFRPAYELPGADRVALSTNSAQHLDELLHATTLDVDQAKLVKYRQLLAARQSASGGETELVNQSEFTAAARRRGGGPPASAGPSGQGDHRS
ncbi:MAG: aldo/keto reductase [Pseudonocardiaceae bacterium]